MRTLPAVVLSLALACSAPAQTYSLKTFAGGVLPENIAGASASLGNVYGIAADTGGNLYLALTDYDIVVKLDAGAGKLTRVAGNGLRGYSGDNGLATSAQLAAPTGLAVDSSGNLYIADANNSRIRKVAAGVISTFAGTGVSGYTGDNGPATQALIGAPAGLAVDSSGALYFADLSNHVVRRVASATITTIAGTGVYGTLGDNASATNAQLAGPTGIALDAAGNLFIAEPYNNRVRKVSKGVITTVAGNGTAGFADKVAATGATLRQPADVAVDASGNLYIADYANNRVRLLAAGASVITTAAGSGSTTFLGERVEAASAGIPSPQRLAVDASGNLYIADADRIRKVTGGIISTVAGGATPAGEGGAPTAAQLLSPQGVAVDSAGNVYFSDSGNGRVLKVAGNTLTRVAGTGSLISGGEGGPPTLTKLNTPAGIALDGSGALYIAENGAGLVRKVAGGSMITVAGGGRTFGDAGPATSALLTSPLGVAADASGTLHISDLNRVRSVTNGAIHTAAGTTTAGFQGDGGAGPVAMLSSPGGLAVDSSGNLLIADTANNRVRQLTNGLITTVAGNGVVGFTGYNGVPTSAAIGAPAAVAANPAGDLFVTDQWRVLRISRGRITTIAGLSGPQGVAVDAAGNVYVADPASHRVRVLSPVGTACNVTAVATLPVAPAAGGRISLILQTGADCPWAIETLPAWITVPNGPYGVGPGAVTLALDDNHGPPRTATIVAGGQNVVVPQAGVSTIVGQVLLRGTAPLAGVTVTLSGAQSGKVVTDSGGNYEFPNLNSTLSYTVTASLPGYAFAPVSQTVSNVTSNPTVNFSAWPVPKVGAVTAVFASRLQTAYPNFAAGEIVTVWGSDLCADPSSAAPTLPDRLSACIVQVDGTNARLYYARPDQINVVLPQTLAAGAHRLVVQRYTDTGYRTVGAQSDPFSFTVDRAALTLLERPDGAAPILLAQFPDGGLAGSARPVRGGDIVTFYGTGLGRKAQTFSEGAAPKTASPAIEAIQVQVAGQAAAVQYAGVQPDYPGFDQITVQLPNFTLPAGASTVAIQISVPATGQTLRYDLNAR
jgi:trimeric autotransporter adhesin